jgi:hypothetical protein
MPPVTNGDVKDALSLAAELSVVVVVSASDRGRFDKVNIAFG